MAGGALEVGVVSIKVRPDMKGFKQAVEAYMSRMRDVEVGVRAKGGGRQLRRDVEQAVEGRTLRTTVDVDASRGLKKLRNDLRKQSKITVGFVGPALSRAAWATGLEAQGRRFRDYVKEARDYAKRIPRETVSVSRVAAAEQTVRVRLDDDSVRRLRLKLDALSRELQRKQPFIRDVFGGGPSVGRAARELKNSIRDLDTTEASLTRVSKALHELSTVSGGVAVSVRDAQRELNRVAKFGPGRVGVGGSSARVVEVEAERTALGGLLRRLEDTRRAWIRYKVSNRVLKDVHLPRFEFDHTVLTSRITQVVQRFRGLRASADDAAAAVVRVGAAQRKAEAGGSRKRRKGLVTVDELGTKKYAGLSRVGWLATGVASLVAPAIQAVSGLAAALPGLGFAAAAALGATALGFEGVKDAAKAAQPAVEGAKKELSGVFKERLTPQFKELGVTLDRIRPGLVRVAHGLSDFSQGMVGAVSSTQGVSRLNSILDGTAKLFSSTKSFSRDFTEGLLHAGEVGARTFPKLAEGLNSFGASFKQSVAELADSGQLQTAIESTYTVLGSLGTNMGRILRSGIESFTPEVAAAYDKLFDGIADGVEGSMSTLSALSSGMAQVAGELVAQIGNIADGTGGKLAETVTNLGSGLTSAVEGLGSAAAGAAGPVSDLTSLLSASWAAQLDVLGGSLKAVGDGFSEAFKDTSSLDKARTSFAELNSDVVSLKEAMSGLSELFRGLGTLWEVASPQGVLFNAPDNLVDLKALQTAGASLDDFMSKWERIRSFGFNANRVELVVETSLRRSDGDGDLAADIEAQIHRLKTLEKVLKIDLKTEINLVEGASSQEELDRISNQIADQFRQGTLGEPVEVPVPVSPKIDVPEGTVDTTGIDASLESSMQNIGSGMGDAANTALQGKATEIGGIAQQQAAETAALVGQAFGDMQIPTEGLTASLGEALTALRDQVVTQTTEISTELVAKFQELPNTLAPAFEGLGSSIRDTLAAVPIDASGMFDTLVSNVQSEMQRVSDTIASSSAGLTGAVSQAFSGMGAEATAAVSGMSASVQSEMASVESSITTAGNNAKSGFVSAMSAMQSESVGLAQSTASGVRGALQMDLTASGVAVGSTFAAGIRSQVGNVSAAASALAAAARSKFPNSPAKEGPFSGAGWVDRSGEAVGRDFAAGIRAGVGAVAGAATALMQAAHAPFAGLEGYHRDKVLQPVLEANARKIHDWRKREADAAERLDERIRRVTESKKSQADKEAEIAKIRAEAAEKDQESYQKMLDSLEAPDYSKINRSIQSYFIDGSKAAATDWLKGLNIGAGVRDSVNGVLRDLRGVLGDNPVFAQVEANVNAESFTWAINKVIEESEIAEVPINFALANLGQLKQDLGMGDGVVSRLIDQVVRFDPNKSDAALFAQQASKTEVHYHVSDMEEAIRLEELRRRKEAMRSK